MELWKNPKKFAAAFAQKTIEIQRCKAWRIEKTEETITITMITLCIGQHRTAQVKKAKKRRRGGLFFLYDLLAACLSCCCSPFLLACLVTPKCFVLIVSSRPFKDLCRRLFF